jgi:predicted transposase YbfD/YdcC
VSAYSSSPITLLAARSGPQSEDADAAGKDLAGRDLLVALAKVPDPRKARGVRHRLVTVLAAAVCAVLAGARSYVAIAEWTRDLPVGVRLRLGLGRCAPSESTIRRILQAVDAQALDTVVSDWLAHRVASSTASCPASAVVKPSQARSSLPRAVAVDGKAARGARGINGRPAHLFAAFDHRSGVVLGQSEVDGKTNEITAFAPLLDRLDLANVVITADALHTQDRHATYLHERGGHYVFIVKGNRPKLRAQLAGLPWRNIPAANTRCGKGHGRAESRILKLAAISDQTSTGIMFPHARLAAQIMRRRRQATSSGTSTWHTETVYAVTDLGWDHIRADHLAEIIRNHWSIENRLHWIRDVTFAEDHSQIRTGNGPAVMATLRNFSVSRHRIDGQNNIAAACRHAGRHPIRAANLLT